MRSVGKVDVSMAARTLGGGGHRLAAGCTVEGTADQVLDVLRHALEEAPLLAGQARRPTTTRNGKPFAAQ
jgi:hypothetical protein